MSDELRLALVQTNLAWQDANANRKLLEAKLSSLANKTDLIILPEMFTSAFSMDSGAIAEAHPGKTVEWMQQQALKLNSALTGSIAVEEQGKRFNRLLFVTPEQEVYSYDKLHLFRMLNEDKRYSAGSAKLIVNYRGWRILPLVCYDLRFPVWCRYSQEDPYDFMYFVANWPAPRHHHWRTLLQARAIENQCWVAGVNRIGTDGNKLEYKGHSVVVNPLGEEVLQAGAIEGVYQTTISLKQVSDWRSKFPAWMDADSFKLL